MAEGLRLATWNIHKGIGTDRVYALERTIEILASIDADVVCLQEVDANVPRSRFDLQSKRLAHELGYEHVALGLNVSVRGGHYGNATLSRLPFRSTRNVDLTLPLKKRRSGLVTRIEGPGGRPWTVANVHLGLMHVERSFQCGWLLDHLAGPTHREDPLVVAGDTNDWGNRIGRRLERDECLRIAVLPHHRKAGLRTFPSRRPLAALDKILVRDPVEVVHVEAIHDERTRRASDHIPLVADLRLR